MGHSLITNMLYSIAQPVLTKTENDVERQKQVFRKLLRFTAFISFPAMFTLSLISQEFIVILITEKWLESASILRVLCLAGAIMPISYLFSNLLISRGHSSTYMWCSIGLCLAQLAGIGLSVSYGIHHMVMVFAIINIVWLGIWFIFSHHEIRLTVREAFSDIAPYAFLSASIVIGAYFLTKGISNIYLSLITKVLLVGVVYCAALWLLGSTIFKETVLFITKKKIE